MEATSLDPRAPRPEILLVEDEHQMRRLLSDNLEFDGYRTTTVATAEEALVEIHRSRPSLILLDVMLPQMSGFELCRVLRQRAVRIPIVLLTARASELDRVLGLDMGADDYVTKPFGVRELLARVRAQLRRGGYQSTDEGEFTFGDVRVCMRTRLVTRGARRVELSRREFELLRYLIAHRGELVSREQLLRDVWGYNQFTVTRTVDNFIAKLRVHLEADPRNPRYIVTAHGSGYQMLC